MLLQEEKKIIPYIFPKLSNFWIHVLAVILIITASLLVYGGSLRSEFHLDDESTITTNRSIRSLKSAILTRHPRPILNFSFGLNYHFSKLNTFSYHLTNLIIHILCAILIFFIIEFTLKLPLLKERFGKVALRIAPLAALIFAVHPLHTESVTYLSSRSECLSSLFYLAALLSFILSIYHPRYKIHLASAAVISTLLGMGSKEIAATIPFLILLYDFMLVSGQNLKELKKRWLFHAFVFSALVLPAYLTIANLDLYGKTSGFGMPYITPLNYLFTEFSVVLYYVKLIFLPFPLNLDYDWKYAQGLFEFPTILSFFVLIAILLLTIRIFKRKPLYAFLIIWYFLILSPSSSIIPLKDVIFEHRPYLPSVGIIWLCLLGIAPFLRSRTFLFKAISVRYLCMALIGIVIPVFGWITIQRNVVWQTEMSLWEDVVRKSPNKPRPHLNLGTAYKRAGFFDKAIVEYKESFRVDPTYARGQSNLGVIYYEMGKVDEALKEIKEALKKNPGLPEIHYNLGIMYKKEEMIYEAIQSYKRAIKLDQEYSNAHYNLGEIYLESGRTEEAIGIYKKVVALRPDLASAHSNLGALYSKKGMFHKAEEELKEAIRLKPREFLPHYNLGITYEKTGRIKDAINEYSIARDIKPDSYEAHNALVGLYKELGFFNEAIKELQALVVINPMDGQNMTNLLFTKKKKARWDKILEEFQKTIKANPNDENVYMNFAKACMQLGMYIKAKQIFYELLEINPSSYEAHLNLGIIFGRERNYEKSIYAFKKALSINPQGPRAYYNIGVSFEKLFMPAKAIKQYQRAIELKPDHENAHINLGVLLAKEKRDSDAILEFEKALRINPNSEKAYMNLGALYRAKGHLAKAEKKLKKAIKLNPSNARAHFHLALVYLGRGKSKEAKQEYQFLQRIDSNLAEELTKFGFKP